MKAIDWLARTAMLVLAALATLSLIGSLASVSNTPIGGVFPGTPVPGDANDTAATGAPEGAQVIETDRGVMTIEGPPAAAPRAQVQEGTQERENARWLRALTYAVLALAAVAAAGVIALVRIATHLRRIAER